VVNIDFVKGLATLEIFDKSKHKESPAKVNYFFKNRPSDIVLDVLPFEELDKESSTQYALYEYPNIESISMLMSNNSNHLGRDPDFRRLIYGLLDREAISAQMRGTLPAYENLPRAFGGNLEKKSLNMEALKEKYGKYLENLKRNGLMILCFTPSSGVKALKPILVNLFKKYGIDVTFIESNDKFLSKESSEQSPFELAGKIVDFFDPRFLFVSLLDSSPFTYQRSLDKNLEILNEKILNEDDREKRYILIRQMSEYVADRAYEIPILEKKRIVAYQKIRLNSLGVQTQPLILKFENIRMVN